MNQYFPDFESGHRSNKSTILVVEDNPHDMFLIKSALEQCMPGVKAIYASNEETALDLLATAWQELKVVPKLILLDLYLPTPAEGLQAINSFKTYSQSRHSSPVPIVMFSTSNQAQDMKNCYYHGANAYMVKSASYQEWLAYFTTLRQYWFETVTLPLSEA